MKQKFYSNLLNLFLIFYGYETRQGCDVKLNRLGDFEFCFYSPHKRKILNHLN